MKQKVIKIGSSIGVVIPKPVAEELGFKAGQEVDINPDVASKCIIVSHPETLEPDLRKTIELVRWAFEFVDKNRALLERLKYK